MKRSVKSVIIKASAGLFICYVLFTLVSLQVSIAQKKHEIADLEAQINDQQIANEETEKILSDGDREELIRRFAENQGYAYQGEKIFISEAGN